MNRTHLSIQEKIQYDRIQRHAKEGQMKLRDMECIPCRGDQPKLTQEEIDHYLAQVAGWQVSTQEDIPRLSRQFKFKNFVQDKPRRRLQTNSTCKYIRLNGPRNSGKYRSCTRSDRRSELHAQRPSLAKRATRDWRGPYRRPKATVGEERSPFLFN